MLTPHYDYIFTGAGCAAFSVVLRILQMPSLQQKRILLIDKDAKQSNDRTWCFWEQSNGFFQNIVYRQYQYIHFRSSSFSSKFNIAPYQYKMIRGIDFYNNALRQIQTQPNITFIQDTVADITTHKLGAIVTTTNGAKYTATYVFNSILFEHLYPKNSVNNIAKNQYHLLQHFKGWIIETDSDVFNTNEATFMDFSIPQKHGTSFVYVLPFTARKALVEYTLFTEQLLSQNEYDNGLQHYIHQHLGISHYSIVEEEFGIIPMTNYPFEKGTANIIHIGTVGGVTKASSGYTFQFIQKHSDAIVAALSKGLSPQTTTSFWKQRFQLYDATLLHVLATKSMPGDAVFAQLFAKNTPQRILAFLDNDTNFLDELKIMSTVPTTIFMPAALRQIASQYKK
ncbi:MAG: lycopene cyclase family protein [Chitinophagaceae bacterium]